ETLSSCESSTMFKPTSYLVLVAIFGATNLAGAADPPPPRPESVSSAGPRTPEEERKGFHVPEGFVVELVASEPDIHTPRTIPFDARGRLWVTDTLEYPFPAAEGTTPRDTVKILEDFRPDGRAMTVRTFAGGLNIPIGVLPLPSGRGAIVHSIPNVSLLA